MGWIIVLHFLWKDGHIQTVRVPEYTFASAAECNSHRGEVRNYISLWPGEVSYNVICQRR
jgi:hypothetical protein